MMMQPNYLRAALLAAAVSAIAAAPTAGQTNANGDIVLYAARATVASGAWSLVSDATAAGGFRLANPDAGIPKRTSALASPVDYFEATFTPEAGRAYHLWIRSKAQNDAWTNDSVFVQFSGSLDNTGAALYRIGSTSAMIYSLEEAVGAGESGWGWQDTGYGPGVLGDAVYFPGGPQTIRVQAREDGISIDQIVLSPVTYATTPPGAAKNDTTILPEPLLLTTTATTATPTGSWGSLVNATASGLTIRKSGGCGDCPDAGGVILTPITSSVSFRVTAGQSLVAGLNTDAGTTTGYPMTYGFSFSGTSRFSVREGGVYRTEGPFLASDEFKIAIEGTTVKYYRNGAIVYTSATPVPGVLYVDATLVSRDATVQVSALNGATSTTTMPAPTPALSTGTEIAWTSFVNATASGSLLTKTGGCGNCPDAGAVSQQQIGSGGSVAFTVAAGHSLVAGLGRDTSAATGYAIDYSFSFAGNSRWEVRELGVYKTEGPFSATDVFTVAVQGSQVRYYRNGSLVYTSGTLVSSSLVVDATLVSTGASVRVTAINAVTTTAPAPGPASAPAPTTTGKQLRVLQWATYHGGFRTDGVYDPDRLANWIVYTQPDVVFLTEIEKNTNWSNQNQPEVYKSLLQQKTGRTWYYVFAQEYGDWNSNGKGNLIMSTYPISYSDRYELVHNGDRSIALASITVNDRPVTLTMTHLDPYDASLRLTQAKEVTAWAAPQPENRILAGDMNAWPDQTSIAHYSTLYHDSWAVAAAQGTATAFAGNYGETKKGRIDYIFYSKGSTNLFVKSSQVYDTRDANGVMASDHRPLLTTFEVR